MKYFFSLLLFVVTNITSAQVCTAILGDPVLNNTFGSGSNFGPQLAPGITNLQYLQYQCPNDGQYAIVSSTLNCWGGNWHSLTSDHTGNSNGYFMLINASIQPSDFFVQTVSGLCSGTTYQFAAWVLNMISNPNDPGSKPNITFSIEKTDGTVLASYNSGTIPITAPPVWKQYGLFFTTPAGVSTVVLRMKNNAVGGAGNDLALDDITFRPAGPNITLGITGVTGNSTTICANSSSSLNLFSVVDKCYISTGYQWQQSTDNGTTWTDIPGATNASFTRLPTSSGTYLYRLAVAQLDNINTTSCCVYSSHLTVIVNPAVPSSINIVSSANNICAGTSVTFTAAVNNEGTNPGFQWKLNGVAVGSNSASYTSGSLLDNDVISCVLTSSVQCTVPVSSNNIVINLNKNSPGPVHLGSDTVICAGTTIVLNAAKDYSSYLWQDGSTGSTYTVTGPGMYSVKTKDVCGNEFEDEIVVTNGGPTIQLVKERIKCNNDTIHIQAPSGFVNYSWSPDYNINSTSGQSVVVNPASDTMYKLKAKTSNGCVAYDSIHIKVHHSPKVSLGTDTSLCEGDSLSLIAGQGFSSFLWNTGSVEKQIVVKDKGTYSVIATTEEGCKTSDTLVINNIFLNPKVNLSKDTFLCGSQDRTLDAGAGYSSYLWSDGSRQSTLTVTTLGRYWVNVIDHNGCKGGSDTVVINTTLPIPRNFLPTDTAVCSYGTIQITPTTNFISYLWSSGSTNKTIEVSKPGVYWLKAKDASSCVGLDSITVSSKQCSTGFYIPDAFTPNNDGKNDYFKPLIFGNVEQYSFSIYNRWGQLVFTTNELQKGWDGTIGNANQNSGVYAWLCVYKLRGEPVRVEKGTVVLIQ